MRLSNFDMLYKILSGEVNETRVSKGTLGKLIKRATTLLFLFAKNKNLSISSQSL